MFFKVTTQNQCIFRKMYTWSGSPLMKITEDRVCNMGIVYKVNNPFSFNCMETNKKNQILMNFVVLSNSVL